MKTLAAVITAFLVSAVLLVVSAPANAAYPKSVATSCSAMSAKLYIHKGVRPRLAFSAAPGAGNGKPTGNVTITYTKKSTGVVVRKFTRAYAGGQRVYISAPLRKKGTYIVKARLVTPASSVFKNCSDLARQVVR
jgi:hypothetical protein